MQSAPVIALVDLQMEYVSAGRAYAISDVEECLERCGALLEHSRSAGLPIAHFRQVRASTYFNGASPFSAWIREFQPRCNEMVFERALPSCYSNAAFCSFLESIREPSIVLAGLTGEEACLSTAIDALHRNHELIFVQDASTSRAINNLSEHDTHELISNIISVYAKTTNCSELLRHLEGLPLRRA
jgi:nicotinamidase-related amidase